METDDHFIVPPATASHSPETVNTLEFSISAVNEVPQGGVANVDFVRWYTVRDVLASHGTAKPNESIDAIALWRVLPARNDLREVPDGS